MDIGLALHPEPPRFDAQELRRQGVFDELKAKVFLHPVTLLALRRLIPTGRFPGIRLIARYDDAREALSRADVFGVPWREKMELLAPTPEPFALATDVPAHHACGDGRLMEVFRYDDGPYISRVAGAKARQIVESAAPDFDVVQELILPVAREVYERHYGIETSDELMLWLMAISTFTFRRIGLDDDAKPSACAAAALLTGVINAAIARARTRVAGLSPSERRTIADRLVELQERSNGQFLDDALRSIFIGMVSGYAPVGTAAAAHIVEVLLQRPKALEMTRQAAADNDERLTRCLLEALRFKPINPGLWRICKRDYTLAAGTWRAKRIRKGEKVMVFLQSAMQDERCLRHPWRFDPDRPASDSMVFGYGMHWCTGAPLGVAQLAPMLKPLLLRGFRRAPGEAGRTRMYGSFPEHLKLTLGKG